MLQVIVTIYEIIYHSENFGGSVDNWSTWARVAKEMSQVLLVAYAALNPIVYCGGLIGPLLVKLTSAVCSCGGRCGAEPISTRSELEMMKSVGITLNGADPIEQQLRELASGEILLEWVGTPSGICPCIPSHNVS